jgi:NCAIR mutase (PurE)-related protein
MQPYEDLDYAKIDLNRQLRTGHGEVVFSLGKSPEQTAGIMKRMVMQADAPLPILATKAEPAHYEAVQKAVDIGELKRRGIELTYHEQAKIIAFTGAQAEVGAKAKAKAKAEAKGQAQADLKASRQMTIAVVTAGTADIPVAEEAALTAELYGHSVSRIYDVGVAGIHRLLSKVDEIRRGDVVIVVAGMEGALASVVAGLVSVPVLAVPTSVGYGVTLGGMTPLFSMLGSCSLGVGVMNIDNGFGAGHLASVILENGKDTEERMSTEAGGVTNGR